LSLVKPNQSITIYTDKNENFTLTTTVHPDNPRMGYLGVIGVHSVTRLKNDASIFKFLDSSAIIASTLLLWVYILSLGIGLANLLPLGPVDGGRMLQTALHKTTGSEKKGNMIWHKVTLLTILILLILLFVPIFRSVLKF
jgi:membrane-associated protease RseP (regulator of RpoE activity)